MILVRNVSANADGIQSVQPCFLAASAPAVSEDLAAADQEHVGNELFVTRVLFSLAPVQVPVAPRR